MGYQLVCSGCGRTWNVVDPADVSAAVAGADGLKSDLTNVKKTIETAGTSCDENALSYNGITMTETINNISNAITYADMLSAIASDAVSKAEAEQQNKEAAHKACEDSHKKDEEYYSSKKGSTR